jgi:hypothetical protein
MSACRRKRSARPVAAMLRPAGRCRSPSRGLSASVCAGSTHVKSEPAFKAARTTMSSVMLVSSRPFSAAISARCTIPPCDVNSRAFDVKHLPLFAQQRFGNSRDRREGRVAGRHSRFRMRVKGSSTIQSVSFRTSRRIARNPRVMRAIFDCARTWRTALTALFSGIPSESYPRAILPGPCARPLG